MWLDDRRLCHSVMPSIANALRASMVLSACKHNEASRRFELPRKNLRAQPPQGLCGTGPLPGRQSWARSPADESGAAGTSVVERPRAWTVSCITLRENAAALMMRTALSDTSAASRTTATRRNQDHRPVALPDSAEERCPAFPEDVPWQHEIHRRTTQ